MGQMDSLYINLPLPSRSSIRLLELRPAAGNDPRICIDLRCVELASATSSFEALSYTWGTNVSAHVLCGPSYFQQLSVTSNCYEALRCLRHPKETRTLWIDAICIDQSNIAERNAQVKIMGDIYAAARQVVIFLGPSTAESRLLFRYLAKIETDIDPGYKPKYDSSLRLPPLDASTRKCIEEIFRRPWFSRIWIIQEVIHAKAAILMCGEDVASWAALEFCSLYHFDPFFGEIPAPLKISTHMNSGTVATCKNISQQICYLLAFSGFSKATDHRDYIIALLPLLREQGASGSGDVQSVEYTRRTLADYNSSVETIYERLSTLILTELGLFVAIMIRRPHSRDMPSWVVDLSQEEDLCHTEPLRHVDRYFNFLRSFFTQRFTISEPERFEGSSRRRLTVRGTYLRRVHELGPEMRLRADSRDASRNLVNGLVEAIDAMRLGREHKHWPDSLVQAFGRFPSKGDISNFLTRGRYDWNEGEEMSELYLSAVVHSCHGSRVCVSSTGALGIVPTEAQRDDTLYFVQGALEPWLLRQSASGHWQLVSGYCFDHEIWSYGKSEWEKGGGYTCIDGYLQQTIPRSAVEIDIY